MRADARRNRGMIVATAVGLFAERGPGVGMEEIAQAAGLGVGTLYRHFPDRQALVEEIAADTLQRLLTAARTLAEQEPSGWAALLAVIEHCAGLPLALAKSLAVTPKRHPEVPRLVDDLDALFARIAERAQKEGSMRADIAPESVVELLGVAVCRAGARPDDALTTVILDGLREPSGPR